MQPPTLCVRDELGGDSAPSVRDGVTSFPSSWRSSAYRAVNEATTVSTSVLEAEAEAKRALALLADSRAECSEQHKVKNCLPAS